MAYRQVFNYNYDQIDVGEIDNMDNSGRRYEWAIQSYFGRLNYNYKERYLLEANLRIDGSSRFNKSNRWGYFPSVSGAWRISEEPFMQDVKHIIDGLKLRASYGTLGNQNLAARRSQLLSHHAEPRDGTNLDERQYLLARHPQHAGQPRH